MKKIIFAMALAAAASISASAQWALVGSYSNPSWNFAASEVFTGEGDDLSCTVENLTTSFKIVDITNDNWDVQYGTSTAVEVGTAYTLDGKNGGPDPSNIEFASPIISIKNATVNWNPSTQVMKITAAEEDIVRGYPTLYVTGGFCEWASPGAEGSILCAENAGIYTAVVNLGENAGTVEFKLAGAGWSNEIAGGVEIGLLATSVTKGGDNLYTNLSGEQTLTFNMNTMLMTFGNPELTESGATPSRKWAVVGSYSDPAWNFEASELFTGEGDNLTCTIENLTTGFKIVDITDNNWDVQYGTSTAIEIGTAYTLDGKNGGADPANIEFAAPVLSVANARISWNPTTHVMQITAAEEDIVKGYPTLYITGSFCGWAGPGEEGSILCTENAGIYTAVVDLGEDAGTVEFKLAGTGWSNEIAGGVEVGSTAVTVTKGGDNLYTNLSGEQTLFFDYETMTMYFEKYTGVETIEAETAVEYYNLQGMKVANPDKGIYIVKKGNTTTKVAL